MNYREQTKHPIVAFHVKNNAYRFAKFLEKDLADTKLVLISDGIDLFGIEGPNKYLLRELTDDAIGDSKLTKEKLSENEISLFTESLLI